MADPRDQTIAALRERVAELEEELAAVRRQPRQSWLAPPELGLTPAEADILRVLLFARPMASKEAIMTALYSTRPDDPAQIKIVDVFVCKLRKKLRPWNIEITTIWGRGYALHPAGRQVLADWTGTTLEPQALAS